MNDILLYIGSGVIIVWGIAHIVPTKNVVNGFGKTSEENKRIITMEWVAEGLALCFIGFLVLFVTALGDSQSEVSLIVYRASAGMLIAMAIWTALTGARTPIVPIKICPFIKTIVAILFILASVL